MTGRIYLDYNATSPMPPEVQVATDRCCELAWGNPGSAHAEGRRAKAVVDRARQQVAQLIGASPEEIVFTSGGTEADNTVLRAVGPGAVVSAVEHKAVLEAAKSPVLIPVSPTGRLDFAALRLALRRGPPMLSIMLANNEVGNVYPIASIVGSAHRLSPKTPVHTDAVQALGKIRVNVKQLGVDFASFSAHKIGGPKGVGALYVRGGASLPPLLKGGGQEQGLRSGTLNVPAIRGFGIAAELAGQRLNEGETQILALNRDRFEVGVQRGLGPRARINGDPSSRLPNTSSLSFAGVNPRELVAALDKLGVSASAGSACSCQDPKPSHVLAAMGIEGGAVRFSFGWANADGDANAAARAVVRAYHRLNRR